MKKLLFIAKSMDSGGTEVSLINLLKKIYKEYDITLALLKKEGVYLEDIPNNVKIIEIYDKNLKNLDRKFSIDKKSLINTLKLIVYKIIKKINTEFIYKWQLGKVSELNDQYDIAIDFHGYGYFGTAYINHKVKTKRKFMFVHDEKIDWIKKVKNELPKFDEILCVSNSCKKKLEKEYGYLIKEARVCRNIIDIEKIKKMSKEKATVKFESVTNLLTIGRLEYQKGYDILIEIAKKLKNNNVKFNWYIIGQGSLEDEIKKSLITNDLKNEVILLGMQKNPYPFIDMCDMYIQPSRHEGYGIAIAEARILNKPIIATKLECIEEQIIDNQNGLLCNLDSEEFYQKIQMIINNEKKKNDLIENLKKQSNIDNNDFKNIIEEK